MWRRPRRHEELGLPRHLETTCNSAVIRSRRDAPLRTKRNASICSGMGVDMLLGTELEDGYPLCAATAGLNTKV